MPKGHSHFGGGHGHGHGHGHGGGIFGGGHNHHHAHHSHHHHNSGPGFGTGLVVGGLLGAAAGSASSSGGSATRHTTTTVYSHSSGSSNAYDLRPQITSGNHAAIKDALIRMNGNFAGNGFTLPMQASAIDAALDRETGHILSLLVIFNASAGNNRNRLINHYGRTGFAGGYVNEGDLLKHIRMDLTQGSQQDCKAVYAALQASLNNPSSTLRQVVPQNTINMIWEIVNQHAHLGQTATQYQMNRPF